MRFGAVRCFRILASTLAIVTLAASLRAETFFGSPDPNEDVRIPRSLAEGSTIARVYIHVLNPTVGPAANQRTTADLERAYALKAGGTFTQVVADQALREIEQLPEVQAAEYRLYLADSNGSVYLALLVQLQSPAIKAAKAAVGFLATGAPRELPLLFRSESGEFKVVANPSAGVYADHNPWMGNPESFNPRYDVPQTIGWPEFGMEFGLSGIQQVGSSPVYFYGSGTYLVSGTLSEDVYSSQDRRVHGETEKLYGGILVARKGGRAALDLSAGRQRFNLNRNLLFGHVLGSINGGERGGSYLSPRNAQDLVFNARLRVGKTILQGFLSDANELPAADSKSRFAGINLKYNDNRRIDASFTFAGAIRSTTAYTVPDGRNLTRNGLRVVNPRIRWDSALGIDGFWLEGELGYEWNTKFAMSAYSAAGWAGYRLKKVPWKPAILYRYAHFSGDDPSTQAYERFDPLLGGVQREWLQGLIMVKMMNNANLRTHRIEASAKPVRGMEIILDFYKFKGQQANNLGAAGRPLQTLLSLDLGYELTPTIQWSINNNFFLQGLVSARVPGKGIELALPEPARTWTTVQLSLYAGF